MYARKYFICKYKVKLLPRCKINIPIKTRFQTQTPIKATSSQKSQIKALKQAKLQKMIAFCKIRPFYTQTSKAGAIKAILMDILYKIILTYNNVSVK